MPNRKTVSPPQLEAQIEALALQLGLDINLVLHEIIWALGEARIDSVTPSVEQFRKWSRQSDGLHKFWSFANETLGTVIAEDDVRDIWQCVELTFSKRRRKSFSFQDYLMIAVRSEQKCNICGKSPPDVTLEIDHILPVSKGGTDNALNLRFLCLHHNRSRGNRFRWADVWRDGI